MRIVVACASVELNGLKWEPTKDDQIQPAAWFCMASIYIFFLMVEKHFFKIESFVTYQNFMTLKFQCP